MEIVLVAMDIENAFDSLDHKFLIYTVEKYDFGKNFILWVKVLLRDQEWCSKVFYLGEAPVKVTQFQLFYLS